MMLDNAAQYVFYWALAKVQLDSGRLMSITRRKILQHHLKAYGARYYEKHLKALFVCVTS